MKNYSKQYINEIAQKSGFLANNTEKVIRLLDVLKFIDEEFVKGTFNPLLLFDVCSAERATKHPMTKWRINNIGKK